MSRISMINKVSNYNKLITTTQFNRRIKQFAVLENQSFISFKQFRRSSFPGLQYLNIGDIGGRNKKSKRNFVIYSGDSQGNRVPSGPFMVSWKKWILGALVTVILPFFTHKWGPLLNWTKKLEAAEEKVEEIAEEIEKVAVGVEKVAEELIEKLPKGGKLRGVLTFVENAAKQVIKDADFVEDFIHKAEDVEKKLETMIEDSEARSKKVAKVVNEVEDVEKKMESMIEDVKEESKKEESVIEDVNAKSKEPEKIELIEDVKTKSKEIEKEADDAK